jgi:hypothetical protein
MAPDGGDGRVVVECDRSFRFDLGGCLFGLFSEAFGTNGKAATFDGDDLEDAACVFVTEFAE